MTIPSAAEWIQLLSNLGTVVGILIAIVVFLNEKRKERSEREYAAYHSLDEKYIEYLELCVDHPELDTYFIPLRKKIELTPEQDIQQCAMLEILICLLERAFLLYRDQSSTIRKVQWQGWDGYIRDWCERENFRRLWGTLGQQFDQSFVDYVTPLVRTTVSSGNRAPGGA
jgi:hypothetical protein